MKRFVSKGFDQIAHLGRPLTPTGNVFAEIPDSIAESPYLSGVALPRKWFKTHLGGDSANVFSKLG
jgi:hypothetical protein